MHLFQILLPCTDNGGKPFPPKDFDRVKEELAQRFDGVTAYVHAPAEGLWRQGNASSAEDILVFEVMTDSLDQEEWEVRRKEYERQFRQERVVIRYFDIKLV